jgi:hypothetical protein
MKKLLLMTALLGVFSIPLCAAEAPRKVEVFGGIQSLRSGSSNATGFNASVAGNINNAVAIVGDFGFSPNSGVNRYSFTVGPQLNHRVEKFRVFGRVLAGATRGSQRTGFTMMLGGGVDFKVSDKISIRPAQLDLVESRFFGSWFHQARYSAGVVFGLGGK